jgi:hypothetical protein
MAESEYDCKCAVAVAVAEEESEEVFSSPFSLRRRPTFTHVWEAVHPITRVFWFLSASGNSMISTCDCNNFFVASFFSSLVVLIDSEELEEEEDEIGENLLSFPEEDFVDDFFDGDDVKSVAFFFSLLLDNIDAPRVLALFERQHAEEVISLSVFIYLFMCGCGCGCVRACVWVLSRLSCVLARVFRPKSHKCRVRLRSFLFFLVVEEN